MHHIDNDLVPTLSDEALLLTKGRPSQCLAFSRRENGKVSYKGEMPVIGTVSKQLF